MVNQQKNYIFRLDTSQELPEDFLLNNETLVLKMTSLKVKLMSGEEFQVTVDLDASVVAAKAAVIAAQGYEEGTKLKLICDGALKHLKCFEKS